MGLGGLDHPGLPQMLFTGKSTTPSLSRAHGLPLPGYRSGAEGVVIDRKDGKYPMMIIPWGELRFEKEPFGVSTGFVQVGDLLAFDAHDDKGPLTTWMACPRSTYTANWSVWWAPVDRKGCLGITLKVVPL